MQGVSGLSVSLLLQQLGWEHVFSASAADADALWCMGVWVLFWTVSVDDTAADARSGMLQLPYCLVGPRSQHQRAHLTAAHYWAGLGPVLAGVLLAVSLGPVSQLKVLALQGPGCFERQ